MGTETSFTIDVVNKVSIQLMSPASGDQKTSRGNELSKYQNEVSIQLMSPASGD